MPTRAADDVEERGTILAAIPRGKPDRSGSYMEEFRVGLDEFKGHPYISLRLWQRGQDGRFYPVPGKGCSVRLGEAEEVAAAILEALRLADSPGAGRPEPEPEPATRPSRPPTALQSAPVDPADRPLLAYAPGAANFNECEGDR